MHKDTDMLIRVVDASLPALSLLQAYNNTIRFMFTLLTGTLGSEINVLPHAIDIKIPSTVYSLASLRVYLDGEIKQQIKSLIESTPGLEAALLKNVAEYTPDINNLVSVSSIVYDVDFHQISLTFAIPHINQYCLGDFGISREGTTAARFLGVKNDTKIFPGLIEDFFQTFAEIAPDTVNISSVNLNVILHSEIPTQGQRISECNIYIESPTLPLETIDSRANGAKRSILAVFPGRSIPTVGAYAPRRYRMGSGNLEHIITSPNGQIQEIELELTDNEGNAIDMDDAWMVVIEFITIPHKDIKNGQTFLPPSFRMG